MRRVFKTEMKTFIILLALLSEVTPYGRMLLSCGKFEENNVTVTYLADDTNSTVPRSVIGESLSGLQYVFQTKHHGIYSLSSALTGHRTVCGSVKSRGQSYCRWELKIWVSPALMHTDELDTKIFKVSCDFISSSMESFDSLRSLKSHQSHERHIVKRSSKHHMDFISGVSIVCPPSDLGPATITAYSDAPGAEPVAICRDGKLHRFSLSGDGQWKLHVYFQIGFRDNCIFDVTFNGHAFVLWVIIPLDGQIHTGTEWTHVISCVYDDVQSEQTRELFLPLLPHKERFDLPSKPKTLSSNIVLFIADVNKKKIDGVLKVGDDVRLVATLNENAGESFNFQADLCHVDSYPILENGCGTGEPFGIIQGFEKQGETVFSPIFEVFRLYGKFNVNFSCTYVFCGQNCDESSCHRGRRIVREIAPDGYKDDSNYSGQQYFGFVDVALQRDDP